ncbi:Lar family restriction alleviation protein [Paraburkholderia sp. JHI2823]|uniref:Lar family restriction alleviation protein n=1 Tax=Paraburkholderia sp. JHI2823 TaxID=3112960 RepID=UPI00316D88EE
MDTNQLKPCPFCGSEDTYTDSALGKRQVLCNSCEASGPTGEDDDEAIAAWNRLAALAPSDAAGAPITWAAVHFGGKHDGKVYSTCDTEDQINQYIDQVHQSSDSITLIAKPLYAAPVAPAATYAQPYALRFPTVLRKMWSGGEVQAWLDELPPLYLTPTSAQGSDESEASPKALVERAQSTPVAPAAVAPVDERAAFEAKFPLPGGVHWDGTKYVVRDGYENSYPVERFGGQWEAWQARAAAPTPTVAEIERIDRAGGEV